MKISALRVSVGCAFALGACSSGDSQPSEEPDEVEVATPAINVAANDDKVRSPMDATPSPDGNRVYYTALTHDDNGDNVPGVFSVAAKGGDIETLASGGALTAPVGITVSLDGKELYIADPAAGKGGALLVLSSAGGEATVLSGTEGYMPTSVVVAKVDKKEQIFFTGRDSGSGEPGLFRTAAGGGASTGVAVGAPFNDPSGVAVNARGEAFVVDSSSDTHDAKLVRVIDGKAEAWVHELGVGFPAGVSLTHDGSTVLVSGLDLTTKQDVVYFVDSQSAKVSLLTKPFKGFTQSAGLHRAHDGDVFAWADSSANSSGTVYVLRP